MKRIILFVALGFLAVQHQANAQFEKIKDSVVQLYGVVMTADSLRGLPAVSISIKGQNRGTVTNDQGIFSIVVLKGDKIEFTSVGYKPILAEIPRTLEGNQFSLIQLMVADTQYLPVTIVKPRPTREQFERDFINTDVPADDYEIARQNTDETKRRALLRSLPADAREAASLSLKRDATKRYYTGQMPPMNILNPLAWADFIKSWKRGDYRKKN